MCGGSDKGRRRALLQANALEQGREQTCSIWALLRIHRCARVLAAGVLFDFARAAVAFLCAYVIAAETGSPLLVQLVGSTGALFLLGAPCIGLVADRLGAKAALIGALTAACMASSAVGVLLLLGGDGLWPALFMYVLLMSACQVLDMTSRPTLICDQVASAGLEGAVSVAMALRSTGFGLSRSVGSQLAAATLSAVGTGGTFLAVALVLLLAILLVLPIPAQSPSHSTGDAALTLRTVCRDLLAGLELALANKAFASILGVTFLANFFWWSHTPLLQVLAARFDGGSGAARAWRAGVLASAPGYGTLAAAVLVAVFNPNHQGLLYCLGAALADATLPGAASSSFPVAVASLFVSGILAGTFGAVQSAMVLSLVPHEMRGRAFGMLGLAISAMPLGMATLGVLAESWGSTVALQGFAMAGCVAQALWLVLRPTALWIRRHG